MLNPDRVDSIVFDLKQSIDDLGNELKIIMTELEKLSEKLECIEKTAV